MAINAPTQCISSSEVATFYRKSSQLTSSITGGSPRFAVRQGRQRREHSSRTPSHLLFGEDLISFDSVRQGSTTTRAARMEQFNQIMGIQMIEEPIAVITDT